MDYSDIEIVLKQLIVWFDEDCMIEIVYRCSIAFLFVTKPGCLVKEDDTKII